MQLPDNEAVFAPILEAQGGRLWTWNLAPMGTLPNLAQHIRETGPWAIVVGYSKQTHNLDKLKYAVDEWRQYAPQAKFYYSVNMHLKLWELNVNEQVNTDGLPIYFGYNDGWIGSANLVQSTLVNVMCQLDEGSYQRITGKLHKIAIHPASRLGTDLKLLPHTRVGTIHGYGYEMALGTKKEN